MSYAIAGIDDEIADAVYAKIEARVKQGIPDMVQSASPHVQAAVADMAPQLIADLRPQLQSTVADLVRSALSDGTIEAVVAQGKRDMAMALAVTALVTIVGTYAAVKYL